MPTDNFLVGVYQTSNIVYICHSDYCIYKSPLKMSFIWSEWVSCMAGDSDVSYGRRRLLTVIRDDGIQSYLYAHYVALWPSLDRIQTSFTISTLNGDQG
jgi:hypothetical protein